MPLASGLRRWWRAWQAIYTLKRMSEAKRGSLFQVALVEWSSQRAAKAWEGAATAMAEQSLVDALEGHAAAAAQKVSAEAERKMVVSAAREVHAALCDAPLPDQARRKVLVDLRKAQLADEARAQDEGAAWNVMATGGLAPAEKERAARTARDATVAWTKLLLQLVDVLVPDPGERAEIVGHVRAAVRKYMRSR